MLSRSQLTAKSPYITQGGFIRLQAEADAIWAKRREVVKALSAAAAEGDRSENAEYIYRKKELREIDRRIRYLQRRLPELKVVAVPPDNSEQIFFAAWVTLEDEAGRERRYRIVGSDEFQQAAGYISIESPLAKALMAHRAEDEVVVDTPRGKVVYRVLTVTYE